MPPLGEQREGPPPPAPGGSSPTPPQRPWYRPSPRWIVIFLIAIGLNIFLTSRAMQPTSRVRVPYSPYFLDQVKGNHVRAITSKGTAIQGDFMAKLSYQGSKPTEH